MASFARPLLAAAVALALPASLALAQAPAFLVEDIDPGSMVRGSDPGAFVELAGSALFAASGDLWRTDGTPAGTHLLRDLADTRDLTRAGVLVFFVARSAATWELWRSDGTTAGTRVLARFDDEPVALTAFGGQLFFSGSDPAHGAELWSSDGTSEGTRLVADIREGGEGSAPLELTEFGGALWFSADDGVVDRELWISDGTSQGTVRFADLSSNGGSFPRSFTHLGGLLFFTAVDGDNRELWVTDGSIGGTEKLTDLTNGSASPLGIHGGLLFFSVLFPSQDELWVSDGTVLGTRRVRDGFFTFTEGASFADAFFFGARDRDNGVELWRSDGTEAGTFLAADIAPVGGSSTPRDFEVVGDRLYFQAFGFAGTELWSTDGTAAGTLLVRDVLPGVDSSRPDSLFALGDRLLFSADDGSVGRELWRSDGSAEGTTRVANLASDAAGALPPPGRSEFAAVGSSLVFRAEIPGAPDDGLYLSKGTAASTEVLIGIQNFGGTTFDDASAQLTPHDGALFFHRGGVPNALWRTNGEPGDATLAVSVPANLGAPRRLASTGAALFFASARFQPFLDALLVSDGDGPAEPVAVVPLNGFTAPGIVSIAAAGGRAFFYELRTFEASKLWTSDGSEAGTLPLADFVPGFTDSLTDFIDLDGTLFFTGNTEASGHELWRSDGTAAGTTLVKDVDPGPGPGIEPLGGSFILPTLRSRFASDGDGTLYFAADDGASGRELWKSDGSEAGTQRVMDVAEGPAGSDPTDLVSVGGRLFFAADDGVSGRELWTSDGTRAGTRRVADLAPGPESSSPAGLVAAEGLVLFAATTAAAGRELWASDGTEAGTRQLADVAPGPASSDPEAFFDRRLGLAYLSADDGVAGRELWALPIGEILGCRDGFDNDGDGLRDFPDDPGCPRPGALREDPACQNGLDDDEDGHFDFDGGLSALGFLAGDPDPDCSEATVAFESGACGLGAELALALPALFWLAKRRRRGREIS